MLEVGVYNPACVQSMIAINWPLLILTDSPEFPRKLTIAGMVKTCENEAKVTNKGGMEIGETCIQNTCHLNIFLLSEYHLFYLEVNLMPLGFLFIVNLLIKKADSTVICVPCMLQHVCYKPFSLKMQIWKISYVNWLNFVYCLKFRCLRPI